ncbi:sigma-70 family RNA polymerase sigma factor [Clavibacter michiganensis]|nr:sigma-70 family RNA polymerase sigma factor [Clavibacter michiganensis]
MSARARFDVIASEVVDPVRRYPARRTDQATADDVLSEVLVVLWRRGNAVPVGEEIPYAIGVARLQLQNAVRGTRRQERLVARIIAVDPPREVVPGAEPRDGRVELVRRALTQLREADAEVLRLHVWEELTVAQIAEVLRVSTNAVSIRLHRAKKKMADRIRKMSGPDGHAAVKEGDR